MSKAKKIELMFLVSGIGLVAGIIIGLISALGYLSSNLINALTFVPRESQQVKFDIDSFNKLKL